MLETYMEFLELADADLIYNISSAINKGFRDNEFLLLDSTKDKLKCLSKKKFEFHKLKEITPIQRRNYDYFLKKADKESIKILYETMHRGFIKLVEEDLEKENSIYKKWRIIIK